MVTVDTKKFQCACESALPNRSGYFCPQGACDCRESSQVLATLRGSEVTVQDFAKQNLTVQLNQEA